MGATESSLVAHVEGKDHRPSFGVKGFSAQGTSILFTSYNTPHYVGHQNDEYCLGNYDEPPRHIIGSIREVNLTRCECQG